MTRRPLVPKRRLALIRLGESVGLNAHRTREYLKMRAGRSGRLDGCKSLLAYRSDGTGIWRKSGCGLHCDRFDVPERDIALSALNPANVGSIKIASCGELLLRQVGALS